MKVTYIAKSQLFSRSANSIHIMKMCQALAKNGHQVSMLVLCEQPIDPARVLEEELFDYYSVEPCFKLIQVPIMANKNSRIRYLISTFLSMASISIQLLKTKPDLVYSRDLAASFASAVMRKSVYFESHSPVWHGVLELFLFRRLLKLSKFNKLVVISRSLCEAYLLKFGALRQSDIFIAHDGADDVQQTVKVALCGEMASLNVGYVGHLYQGKGVEVVAQIASKLPNVNFHVIGGLEEDISYWKDKCKQRNVYFYGFIEQRKLPNYIASLDVCLLPNQKLVATFGDGKGKRTNISEYTSPLKMFEYMSHKKAIIASDLTVLREVLDEKTALFVPPEDYGAWVEAILKLQDAALRTALGNAAYAVFIKNYTWTQRAQNIMNIQNPAN